MKRALLSLVVFIVSLSVVADPGRPGRHHRNPGHHRGPAPHRPAPHRPLPPVVIRPRPIPRPAPSRVCRVVMTDRMNRVVRRYQGWSDYNGQCRDGLRQCHFDLQRMGMWGYRCATVRW